MSKLIDAAAVNKALSAVLDGGLGEEYDKPLSDNDENTVSDWEKALRLLLDTGKSDNWHIRSAIEWLSGRDLPYFRRWLTAIRRRLAGITPNFLDDQLIEEAATGGLRNAYKVWRAGSAVGEYMRQRMNEKSFMRKIMPPMPISNEELDRSVDTDKPVVVIK